LLITSGAVGALYSLYDIARGRGVLVSAITSASPFKSVGSNQTTLSGALAKSGSTQLLISMTFFTRLRPRVSSPSVLFRGANMLSDKV
jgi:hypothetical protein